jgi:RimJ/RimL family protein N-acetyltransferase
MDLVVITDQAQPQTPIAGLPDLAHDVMQAFAQLYRDVGYQPPWVGYLVLEDDVCIGTCAFKSPPRAGEVEIAYFTFPEHEGRGFATRMAARLVQIARAALPGVVVVAQTLPEDNASTAVLRKIGFAFTDERQHPTDGLVWEWRLLGP